jgi:predicted nucleotidyltransferase
MKRIQLDDAIDMVRNIEAALAPIGYHIGLRGSVLIEGESENDLDIVVYPHNSTNRAEFALHCTLGRLGMRLVRTVEQSHEHWRRKGSTDEKRIEIWNWNGIVMDMLLA